MINNKLSYNEVLRKKSSEISDFLVQLHGNLDGNKGNNNVDVDMSILHFLSDNEKSVKMIFDTLNFKVVSVTKNVETILGVSMEGLDNFGQYIMSLTPEHKSFVAKIISLDQYLLKEGRENGHYNFKVMLCGLTLSDTEGRKNRFLIRYSPINYTENRYANTAIISIEKINFMMKSDLAWLRVTYGENESKIACMSTADSVIKKNDIISDREKDVLRCLAAGMDAEEMSKTLFISLNTIIKHRKNMLARTGLRDTTALIQICQACGILA